MPDRIAASIFVALCLAGCMTTRPAESPEIRETIPTEAVYFNDKKLTPDGRGKARKRRVANILALSGGGSHGAYGAGFLTGWTESGTRPKFDIVTGVSTGALMAIYAFLGPEYDAKLRELYTEISTSDIYSNKGPSGFLSDSLYDYSPLKRQIEKNIDQAMLNRIAAEHRKGRRLYVATTNLDSTQLVVWDMGDIAAGGRTNDVQMFQKVIRASATVPAFFKPVYIKPVRGVQLRQAHVDGGITAPVLLSDFLFRVKASRRNLFVVVNSSLSSRNAVKPVKPEVSDIARKAIGGLSRSLLQQTVYRGYVRATKSKTRFFLTSIPDREHPLDSSLKFNRKNMRKLFTAGRRQALSRSIWQRRPPTLQVFDVVD